MRKILFLFMLSMTFVFALTSCRETPTETAPTNKETQENPNKGDEYVETNLDDGKVKTPYALRVYDNGNNVVYFGEKFTGEGYVVKFVYQENENMGTDLPLFSAVTLSNFSIDDSKVDYRKEGRYVVKITGRVRSDVLSLNVFITVKADKYEHLGVKHLYGISCPEYVNFALNGDLSTLVLSDVYGIYTENKYDENEELVKISEKLETGYQLDTSKVDVATAGSYPVYVSYSEIYGEVTIKVETFFILIVA